MIKKNNELTTLNCQLEKCHDKQKLIFSKIKELRKEEKYDFIINHGKSIPLLSKYEQTKETLIYGCQSESHIKGYLDENHVFFMGDSSSLISRGIISIMIEIYDMMYPEAIIKSSFKILEDLEIETFLSISRSAGFVHVENAQKKICLQYLKEQAS